ncbi:hypothetical protein ACC806_34615 [Rhizobium ruizarguesonis]
MDSDALAFAKAEFEKQAGVPFDPAKVAFACDACADDTGYTCDRCGRRCMSTPDWSDAHATAEYETTFGRPVDRERAAVLCDDCYAAAMADHVS